MPKTKEHSKLSVNFTASCKTNGIGREVYDSNMCRNNVIKLSFRDEPVSLF